VVLMMIFRPTGLAGRYEFSLYRLMFERGRKAEGVEPKKGGAS